MSKYRVLLNKYEGFQATTTKTTTQRLNDRKNQATRLKKGSEYIYEILYKILFWFRPKVIKIWLISRYYNDIPADYLEVHKK